MYVPQVTDPEVDMFDREAVFIQQKLIPVLDKVWMYDHPGPGQRVDV